MRDNTSFPTNCFLNAILGVTSGLSFCSVSHLHAILATHFPIFCVQLFSILWLCDITFPSCIVAGHRSVLFIHLPVFYANPSLFPTTHLEDLKKLVCKAFSCIPKLDYHKGHTSLVIGHSESCAQCPTHFQSAQ